jgi:hypothetical protein
VGEGAHYARNLVAATRDVPALEPAAREQLTAALDGELQKVGSLAATISGKGRNGGLREPLQCPEYLLGRAYDSRNGGDDPRTEQWRALSRLDGTLSQLAANLSRPPERHDRWPAMSESANPRSRPRGHPGS